MEVLSCVTQALDLIAPSTLIPSLGVALLVYLLVTRQIEMIQEDPATEDFGTAGEQNEWLGGPTSEYLGV